MCLGGNVEKSVRSEMLQTSQRREEYPLQVSVLNFVENVSVQISLDKRGPIGYSDSQDGRKEM